MMPWIIFFLRKWVFVVIVAVNRSDARGMSRSWREKIARSVFAAR